MSAGGSYTSLWIRRGAGVARFPEASLIIPLLTGLLALIFSLFVVLSKNIVYGAIYLSLLGLMVAALIAMLGYPIVAVLHIIIYVGAGVLFIVMSVSMIREVAERRVNRPLSFLVALVASSPLFYLAAITDNQGVPQPAYSDYAVLSKYIAQNYWMPALLVFLSLSASLIAAVSITRARGGRR